MVPAKFIKAKPRKVSIYDSWKKDNNLSPKWDQN